MDPPEDWDPSEEERDGLDSITCAKALVKLEC